MRHSHSIKHLNSMPPPSKDTIIVIAWPDKRVRLTPGSKWLGKTGIMGAKDGTIEAGHAGSILVETSSGTTKYYDYGRYGQNKDKGIVRCSASHPLSVPDAELDLAGDICNIDKILLSVAANKLFAGYGRMIASVCKGVRYTKMITFAEELRSKGETAYGPFKYHGTNCARFVADLIIKGDAPMAVIADVWTNVTPSPWGNVENADTEETIYTVENNALSIRST
ncbi:DUF6695 family protein [Corallococcus sp. CA054B]|uniref:DUF6695 family protein n=1 Tax=Corallococcus sp. CA054B TaxID=2316734 RepID=UPI0011C46689|nr:DUF6695 family protein [Corallococcus sp. CA054B]